MIKMQSFQHGMFIIEWEKKRKPFSTDKSNYSHRTPLPGTKLFLVVKTVNKWWKLGWGDQWPFEVFSLFKISTVACLFASTAVESSRGLHRKLCGLGTPFQGAWTAALKQEALGDGLIVFRSLNKCLLGRLPHSCVCLWTITSWAEQAIQLRLYKGQERSIKHWGLDSRFSEGMSMSSIMNNNHHMKSVSLRKQGHAEWD